VLMYILVWTSYAFHRFLDVQNSLISLHYVTSFMAVHISYSLLKLIDYMF
jgi:hypothetical protein